MANAPIGNAADQLESASYFAAGYVGAKPARKKGKKRRTAEARSVMALLDAAARAAHDVMTEAQLEEMA